MHVDLNQGPSFIIGLGYLVDDGLWSYDEAGTITQKVTNKLYGHPQFDSSDGDRRGVTMYLQADLKQNVGTQSKSSIWAKTFRNS